MVTAEDEDLFNKTQQIFATGNKVQEIVGIMSRDQLIAPLSIKTHEGFPSRFRVGDIDSDGFPDLIGLFNTEQGTTLPVLLSNQNCPNAYKNVSIPEFNKSEYVTSEESREKCKYRSFVYAGEIDQNYYVISNLTDSEYIFLHDADDNGIQDVFSVSRTFNLTLLYNNLISVTDGFSVSAMMVEDMKFLGRAMVGI